MQNDKYTNMGKEELRAACRAAGVSYSKLNNDGMRDALRANEPRVASVETEDEAPAPVSKGFMDLITPPAPTPVSKANVTRVVDGKKVEATQARAKREPRSNDKPAAPAVPRVSCKGYTIQKERETRNGVKRPSEGTVCGSVWAEFDKNPEIKAGELSALADKHGWNRTNVSCEFYNWRKFMGIKGRSAK